MQEINKLRKQALMNTTVENIIAEVLDLEDRNKRLAQWVNDLQAECFINCVYCGLRYGPDINTPVSMADILKEHISSCPEHPMFELKEALISIRETILSEDDPFNTYPKLDKVLDICSEIIDD